MLLHVVGIDRIGQMPGPARGGVTAQLAVVEIVVDRIEPEAVDAALEPEAHDVEHRVLHIRIVEVEIGLLGEEIVEVILAAAGVPLPGATAEDGRPVVGRRTILLGIGPDIPVSAGIGAAELALAEPGVFGRGVRQHLVHDHLHAERVGAGDQRVEIVEAAEEPIDLLIVGDIVAHVGLGRLVDRREPDAIDAEGGNVIEAAHDAREVTDAVTVAVLKGARIDLIDHSAAPPFPHAFPSQNYARGDLDRLTIALRQELSNRFNFPHEPDGRLHSLMGLCKVQTGLDRSCGEAWIDDAP